MLALISSVLVATVCKLRLICSVAAETTLACAEVSSELAVICWLVAENSSLAVATCCAFKLMESITPRNLLCILFTAAVRSPSSFALLTFTSARVRSPAAIDLTGVFCTSGSEREFTLEGSWYADEEIQAGADCDTAAAGLSRTGQRENHPA